MYSLHQLFYQLDEYISEVMTLPDLHVVGLKDLHEEFDRPLQLKCDEPVSLYYDTTFKLGDFYVSVLCFRHIMF